jgi:uncharacterized protein
MLLKRSYTMNRLIRMIASTLTLTCVTLWAVSAKAEPAIWVVRGPHATVYLFGTVHVLRKDTKWHSPRIDKAIKESQGLWLEVPDPDNQEAVKPLIEQLGLDAAHPLSTKLSKEQLASLDAAVKAAGIPSGEAALEPLRPWMAGLSVMMVPLLKAGYDPNGGVDKELKAQFTQDGKSIHGFETMAQQLHFFADLEEKNEIAFLESTLKDIDKGAAKLDELVSAWSAGDVEKIFKIENRDLKEVYPDLYAQLIVKRNKSWIKPIVDLLKGEGTSLVAVGAGHLAGPDGLAELLKQLGYTVEQL